MAEEAETSGDAEIAAEEHGYGDREIEDVEHGGAGRQFLVMTSADNRAEDQDTAAQGSRRYPDQENDGDAEYVVAGEIFHPPGLARISLCLWRMHR